MAVSSRLGIVAGAGDVPGRLIASCQSSGRDVFVLGLKGYAEPDAFGNGPDAWIRMGQVGKGLDILRDAGVRELVIAGRVKRPSLTQLRPDAWTAKLMMKAGKSLLGDNSLLSTLVQAIEGEGFTIIPPEEIIGGLLVEERQYGKVAPDADARLDIEFGARAAKAIGALDIGQAAVSQQGYILGLEAAEGTDALIERCASLRLQEAGGVLVKVSKPIQDRRVDLPTIGIHTITRVANAGLRGIAIEAGGTLIVDAEATVRAADEAGIFIVGVRVDG